MSTEGWSDRNCSRRTSFTVWVTRGFVIICNVPPAVWTFLTSCTKAPRPELSTKSICERSRMKFLGLSSTNFSRTLRKVGSEKASSRPARRKSWQLSLTSRVPLKLTVRVSASGIEPSSSLCHHCKVFDPRFKYRPGR